jgi:hypothetical protein
MAYRFNGARKPQTALKGKDHPMAMRRSMPDRNAVK